MTDAERLRKAANLIAIYGVTAYRATDGPFGKEYSVSYDLHRLLNAIADDLDTWGTNMPDQITNRELHKTAIEFAEYYLQQGDWRV